MPRKTTVKTEIKKKPYNTKAKKSPVKKELKTKPKVQIRKSPKKPTEPKEGKKNVEKLSFESKDNFTHNIERKAFDLNFNLPVVIRGGQDIELAKNFLEDINGDQMRFSKDCKRILNVIINLFIRKQCLKMFFDESLKTKTNSKHRKGEDPNDKEQTRRLMPVNVMRASLL